MSLYSVNFEELWEPWEIVPGADLFGPSWRGELPDDLVERFHKAKKELDTVWEELHRMMREDH